MQHDLVKQAEKKARNYYRVEMKTKKIPSGERLLGQGLGIGFLSALGGTLGYSLAKKPALRGKKALIGALLGSGVGLVFASRFPKERAEVTKINASSSADVKSLMRNLGLDR